MAISNTGRATRLGQRMILSMAIAGVAGGATSASAASATFSGAATPDTSWATPTNWVEGAPAGDVGTTTNTDTATFTSPTNPVVTIDPGRNVQNIQLTGGGGSTGSFFTIGTTSGPALLLTSGGLIQSTNKSGANTSTVAAPVAIQGDGGTYTVQSDLLSTRTLTLSGGLSGVSSGGNLTTLTLRGFGTGQNAVSGAVTDGAVGGKLAIVKSDTGLWSLANAGNTFSGGITANAGTIQAGATNNYPTASYNSTTYLGTGAITLAGGTVGLLGSGSAILANFNNALNVTGGTIAYQRGGTFAPATISAATAASTLTFTGAVTLTVADFKNFAGVIDTTGLGTLRLGTGYVGTSLQNARLNVGTANAVSTQFGTNGTLTETIGALSGGGTFGNTAGGSGTIVYAIGTRAEDTTYAGVIAVGGGTKNAINKVGANALTLTGVNTYTGATTVTGGTLALSGTGSIAASPTIAVGAAGTLDATALTGGANYDSANGRFALASGQTLALAGTFRGTLAATVAITPGGAAAIGAANVNSTTLVAGSTLTADVSSATSDALNVVGTIDLGGATLTLNNLASPTAIGQLYTLVANDGTDPTVGTFGGLADGATVVAGVDSYTLRYNAFGGNDVTLTALTAAAAAVPEPTTLAAVGLAGLVLKRRRRA